jgi:hypothetical protein
MENIFEVNGRNFSAEYSFPPIDEEHMQNAIMIAPFKDQMYVYGWGCYNYTGDKDCDVWEWEPLYPLNAEEGMALLRSISQIRKDLGI